MGTHGQRQVMNAVASLAVVVVNACASAPRAMTSEVAVSTGDRFDARFGGDRLTLTAAELMRPNVVSTVDAIRQVRPEFLMGSARVSGVRAPVALFVNDNYDGDVSGLSSIPLEEIKEVIFLHPAEAQLKYGLRCHCDAGALVVRLKRPGR